MGRTNIHSILSTTHMPPSGTCQGSVLLLAMRREGKVALLAALPRIVALCPCVYAVPCVPKGRRNDV